MGSCGAASRATRDMNAKVIAFSRPLTAESSSPAADRLIAGDPRQAITNYFADRTEQFFAGRWSSTRGKWRIRYSESEFCCLTQGHVALENLAGERWQFGPG